MMQLLKPLSIPIPNQNPRISPNFATLSSLPVPSHHNPRLPTFVCFSSSSPNGDSGEEPAARDDAVGKERRDPSLFNLRLGELLEPDPDNLLAVGLTGLLAWASLQVLSQLFFISLAILVAALKYSFIAAILLFILITLL